MSLTSYQGVSVVKSMYWHKYESESALSYSEEAGKWVVQIRKAYNGMSQYQQKTLLERVIKLCKATNVGRVWVSSDNITVLVFTTADRFEILACKIEIIGKLAVRNDDLLWKAHFETDSHWEKSKGHLWFISSLEDSYNRAINYLLQGRIEKSQRIRDVEVTSLLARARWNMLEEAVMSRSSMVIAPSFPIPDYEIDPNMVFIVMPFTESWSEDFYFIIKQAAEESGMFAVRSDDIFSQEIVMNDIWALINKAGLIIVDITKHNANVFYELGISHTLGKKVVLLRQDGGENAPFDISYWRYFNYALSPLKAKELKSTLEKIFSSHLKSIKSKSGTA